jgi:hypothetical protein
MAFMLCLSYPAQTIWQKSLEKALRLKFYECFII